MAAIKINGKTVQRIYKGENEVKAVYKGNVKVWERYLNIDKFHSLIPYSITASKLILDYSDNYISVEKRFRGFLDIAETIALYYVNATKEILVLSDQPIKVQTCARMFFGYRSILSFIIKNLDTSEVTDCSNMFSGCQTVAQISLFNFDFSNVTNTMYMFGSCSQMERIFTDRNPSIEHLERSNGMFLHTDSIKGGNGTVFNSEYVDKTYFRIDTPETPGYLTLKTT